MVRGEAHLKRYDFPVKAIYQASGPFDRCLRGFRKQKLEVPTAAEVVKVNIFIQDHPVTNAYKWVAEGVVYLRETGGALLVSRENNPILKAPFKAARANEKGKEFTLTKRIADALCRKADFKDIYDVSGILYVPEDKLKQDIPAEILPQSPVCSFLFGDSVKDFQRFLLSHNAPPVKLDLRPPRYCKSERPFARLLFLGGRLYQHCISDAFNLDYDEGQLFGFDYH
ncbi:hypothetical protein KY309_00890 [Candidatus Woesearchaeota archaeon]|nr:hypothetical protein [Candidatus Woesearchaeota archaeon]MBW3016150.1 hypothetical protein [Candidatus Woesearchaeota archaeon]